MSAPAPRRAREESEIEEHGWPEPRPGRSPVHVAPAPRRRARRYDRVAIVLALLGLALGVAALAWFLTIDRSAPRARLTVPRVVGMPERAAIRRLTTRGFNVRAIERPGDAPAGRVFEQRPGPLTTLARGATVTIRVANGRAP